MRRRSLAPAGACAAPAGQVGAFKGLGASGGCRSVLVERPLRVGRADLACEPREVEAARRRPRGGVHAAGVVEAMLDLVQGRVRAHRLPLPGAGLRVGQLPRPGAAAQARHGRAHVRQERLREAPLRPARPHVASTASSCWPTTSPSAARTCSRSSPTYLDVERRTTTGTRAAANVLAHEHRPRRRADHDDAATGRSRSPSPSGRYLGKGKFQRRDFRFDTLTQMSSFGEEGTLFADLGKHEIFTPTQDLRPLTVADIAGR